MRKHGLLTQCRILIKSAVHLVALVLDLAVVVLLVVVAVLLLVLLLVPVPVPVLYLTARNLAEMIPRNVMVVVIEDAISQNLEVDLPLLLDLVESLLLVVKEGKSNAEIWTPNCYLNYQLFLVLPEMINTCSRYLFLSTFFFLTFLFIPYYFVQSSLLYNIKSLNIKTPEMAVRFWYNLLFNRMPTVTMYLTCSQSVNYKCILYNMCRISNRR